jgi:hypothetical protein
VFEGSVIGGGALMRQPRWRTSRVSRRGQLDTDPEGYVLVHPPSTRTTLAGVLACGDVVDRTYRHQHRPGRLRGLPPARRVRPGRLRQRDQTAVRHVRRPEPVFRRLAGPRSITMSAKTPIQAAAKPGRRTTGQAGVRCQRCGPAGNRQLLKPHGSADPERTCWQPRVTTAGAASGSGFLVRLPCRVRPSRVAFPARRGLALCSVLSADRRTGHHVPSMLTIGIPSRDQRLCRMDTPMGILRNVGRPARPR